ncbi:MAG: hypothetical protein GJ678_03725 [Rhodobacteraceae bacterium]|nr:hypothetical protein [Paracoccaceae bacterium]
MDDASLLLQYLAVTFPVKNPAERHKGQDCTREVDQVLNRKSVHDRAYEQIDAVNGEQVDAPFDLFIEAVEEKTKGRM